MIFILEKQIISFRMRFSHFSLMQPQALRTGGRWGLQLGLNKNVHHKNKKSLGLKSHISILKSKDG